MKQLLFLFLPFFIASCGVGKLHVSSNPSGASIIIDGQRKGSTPRKVPIENTVINLRVEKPGFITESIDYINTKKEKKVFVTLRIDDAFESSFSTDIANNDIELTSNNTEKETWKLLAQIVTNHFDIIEISDLNTRYLRTSWIAKSFNSSTIRTRLIIKPGINSATYKVKIISERAAPGTSVKDDQQFEVWDRLLRTYEPIIREMQNRLVN